MRKIYNILTHVAGFHLNLIAPFNKKLQLGVKGRKETFKILKQHISPNDKVIWFHCASLGEYEQGLPVFEQIKEAYPNHKIVLSFFSPSGFEIRKNAPIADSVVYLPLDTASNAKRFIDLTHPELIVFVKYEIWPNYLNEIKKRGIRALLISALFKKDHVFFKSHGKWMQKYLQAFEHIFVQNKSSYDILSNHSFTHISISGDTRFDRVTNQLSIDNSLPFIESFKNNHICIVAGSTWPEGEKLLANFINVSEHKNVKFIIAPHNMKAKQIEQLKNSIKQPSILFSEKEGKQLENYKVFIVNTIGILSKIYSYADIAYVGGGLGNSGLHNTLEAAVFGVPIIIGQNHDEFPEAIEMKSLNVLFSISNQEEFDKTLNSLISNKSKRQESGNINAKYISNNTGAVNKIMSYLTNS